MAWILITRRVRFKPEMTYFKPRGVPVRSLEVVELTHEEVEALRLKNKKDLKQIQCAERMKTSQSTFQRILSSAYEKVTEELVEDKAMKIVNPS